MRPPGCFLFMLLLPFIATVVVTLVVLIAAMYGLLAALTEGSGPP